MIISWFCELFLLEK